MRLFPHKATHDSGKERTTVDTQPATRPDSHADHTEKSDTEKSHTDTSPSEVVRWFLTAFQNRDIETTLLLVDPSAEVNIYSVGVRAGGVDQLRNLLEQTRDAFPDLLLRYGLTDRLELRLGWPGYVVDDFEVPQFGAGGALNPSVGIVYDLWGQHGPAPQTAIHAAIPIPLEGNAFALNSLQPLTELLYAWYLNDAVSLTGRSGIALFEVEGDHFTQFQQGLSLDFILTERLATFLTWEMLVNHGAWNDDAQHMGGGGLSFLLTERVAVTWRAAAGLNAAAPDFLNDIRFALRF